MADHDESMDVDTELHEPEGSIIAGWPAILTCIGIIAAAIYSFSPRPDPPFPETRVHQDGLLINDVARLGSRFVGVGEQGRIMVADAATGPWNEASVSPQRGSTLTRLLVLGDKTAIAVGHDSWILRSTDSGASWSEILFDAARSEPLLGVSGPFNGKIYAYGAFGQLQVSVDQGKSWTRESIVAAEEEAEEAAYDPTTDPESDQYNPFAAFSSGSIKEDFSKRHINHIAQLGDGSLMLVGERGLIARSSDGAATWKKLDDIYSGSFYGILAMGKTRALVHGMRGHVFYSDDLGKSWVRSRVPVEESLFGAATTGDGDLVLVGGNNTIIVSGDRGATFRKVSVKGADALAGIVPLGDSWLTGGEAGLAVQKPALKTAAVAATGERS